MVLKKSRSHQPSRPAHDETILLVENSRDACEAAALALRDFGYNVIRARDAAEALSLIQQHSTQLNLIITDVILTNVNAPKWILAIPVLMPVLYLSTSFGEVLEASKLPGQKNFLKKPFSAAALRRAVRKILDEPPG